MEVFAPYAELVTKRAERSQSRQSLIDPQAGRNCAERGRRRSNFGRLRARPKSAKFDRNRLTLGQARPKLRQSRSILVAVGPGIDNIGQIFLGFGHICADE